MSTPQQSRAELSAVTGEAVAVANDIAGSLEGSPEARRLVLLDTVPGVIDYYAVGSAALAADFYDERRALAGAKHTYTTGLVINDRTVKVRRAVAWASAPLFAEMSVTLEQRLSEVIRDEVARPYRDTITGQKDPAKVGWRRVQGDSCRFCSMLAARGAVYRESTARFAAHSGCDCGAEPVFDGQAVGPEASAMQYMASKRSKTPKQKAELKAYLDTFFPA